MPTKKQIKQENYLGLPVIEAECILTHAPLNSSGDIYHILAYLILSTHFKNKIPQVMLTYDVATTKKQADRALNFANSLSYASIFRIEKIASNNAHYENVRQSQLEKHLKDKYSKNAYLDQMATTTIIAQMFMRHGFTEITQILQRGFSKYQKKHFPLGAQQKVREYVEESLEPLKQNLEKKPILVLHIRYAKGANNRLNIPDNLVTKLITFLNEKGYDTWCVLADDRKRGLPNYSSRYTSRPFNAPVQVNGCDFSKFQHLQLMSALAQNELIKGVIGNTSGTLDACAFVGNRVYNIHQFNDSLSYQDLRLAMQCTFLSAEDLDLNSWGKHQKSATPEEIISDALPNFSSWLLENKETTPSIEYKKFQIPRTKSGFNKMLYVFMPENTQKLHEVEDFLEIITNTVQGRDDGLIQQGRLQI